MATTGKGAASAAATQPARSGAELDPDEMLEEEGPVEAPPERLIDEETLRRREAALARIVQFGDPVLKSRASTIGEFDAGLAEEITRMAELMQEALGVGLAAPQVGKLRRLLVFQPNPDVEPRELVNPEIEWLSEEADVATEGCLSIPRILVEVERPVFARVRGRDRHGAEVVIEASGFEARVLQHEIDHLDGVLILDRTERSQRRAALRALRRGESFSPVEPDPEPDDMEGAQDMEVAEDAAGPGGPKEAAGATGARNPAAAKDGRDAVEAAGTKPAGGTAGAVAEDGP